MALLVTMTEAAKLAGVSVPNLSKMKKAGATYFVGTNVDIQHDAWIKYIAERQGRLLSAAAKEDNEKRNEKAAATRAARSREAAEKRVASMDDAKQRRLIEQARIAELHRLQLEGTLVDANLVKQATVEYLTILNRSLLKLGERTADRIIQLARGIDNPSDARIPIIDLLTQQVSEDIKKTKAQMVKSLKKAKSA